MKKSMLIVMVAVLMVAVFAGCPRAPQEPDTSGDGQFVPPVVPPEPEVQQGLIFQGNLYPEEKTAEKYGVYPGIPNANLQAMGDAFKAKAATLCLAIYEDGGYGKGGGYSDCLYRSFPLVNGEWYGFVPLNPGSYSVQAQLADKDGYRLFEASSTAVVNADQNTNVGLRFDFLQYYSFRLGVYNLPDIGIWDSEVHILEYSTDMEYYGHGSRDDYHWVMWFDLPLDFLGGTMYFVDQFGIPVNGPDGQPLIWNLSMVPWQIDWDNFNFGSEWLMAYQPAVAGSITVDVSFAYEERYIRVNGFEFNSVAEAVQQSASPVTVELGAGDYLGFWANGADAKDVRIVGVGANRTRLVRDDNDGAIIMMDPVPSGQKAGGWRLILDNLTVSAYSNATSWPPSAIQLWGCAFDAYNCYFEGSQSPIVCLSSSEEVVANHCWFQIGDSLAILLDYYDPARVRVQNSIFTGWQFTALWLSTYYDNGADGMVLTNCCFSGGVSSGPEFVLTTNPIFTDPMLDWQTKLPLPGSPCIGTGTGGSNIGLLWTE